MIEYARARDGTHLAFEVSGQGPPLLMVSDGFIPVDAMPEEPSFRACLERLSSFSTLVRFDRRGVGASDPPPDHRSLRIEDWAEDALAVLDHLHIATAHVMASVENSGIALVLAALQPERVSGLVLVHASARGLVADDYPIGFDPSVIEALVEATTDTSSGGLGPGVLALNAPSAADDPAFRDWWQRAGRRGASPAVARQLLHLTLHADVRWTLPLVQAPVLVLHREGDALVPASHGRYIADRVGNGRFVLLPGADDLWWVGDTAPLLEEVEAFVRLDRHVAPWTRGPACAPDQQGGVPGAGRAADESATGAGAEVIAALLRRRQAEQALSVLSPRERDILALMGEGYSNAAICQRLYLTTKTVETHISRIFRKLELEPSDDVHRRVAAVLRLIGTR